MSYYESLPCIPEKYHLEGLQATVFIPFHVRLHRKHLDDFFFSTNVNDGYVRQFIKGEQIYIRCSALQLE